MTKTVLAITVVLFTAWSTAANAQLGGLISSTLQTLTGQPDLTIGLPGVAEVVVGGAGGNGGAGVALSVLGGGDSNSTSLGGLGVLTLNLPSTGPQGGAPNDHPTTEHPGWIGGDPTGGGGGGGGGTTIGGGGNNGTQLALGTAPTAGVPGSNSLSGGSLVLGDGVSSRLRTLLRVMEERAWYQFADGNSLCLSGFGSANVTGWLRRQDIGHLDAVVTHYRSDIAQLQKMIGNCRANRSIISRSDIKRIIGLDIRNGQPVLFML